MPFDGRELGEQIVASVREFVSGAVSALSARIDALDARQHQRITDLEARLATVEDHKGLRYRGAWLASTEYGADDLVTHGGQLWLCLAFGVRSKPGSSDSWRLCSKKDLT
jgi:hypothetical protein